jgi:hypothetical protein
MLEIISSTNQRNVKKEEEERKKEKWGCLMAIVNSIMASLLITESEFTYNI